MKKIKIISLIITIAVFLSGCNVWFTNNIDGQNGLIIGVTDTWVDTLENVPAFSDEPYVILNDNKPHFTDDMLSDKAYEFYSELDELGRCGYAIACIGTEIMPTEERGEIGMIKPTGWQTVKYDVVDGKYLYNRCHLIGYQLTGENANELNLITGTRYLNMEGMLPFENLIADYINETGNHVLYRVTPIFEGDNLVAKGVQMEGYSVEDDGAEICFNIFAYNAQPDIKIDYATGNSVLVDSQVSSNPQVESSIYIININSKKFHIPECSFAKEIKPENKLESSQTQEQLKELGYLPCKSCLGQ